VPRDPCDVGDIALSPLLAAPVCGNAVRETGVPVLRAVDNLQILACPAS
jgi:hypothetical protein